MPQPTPLDDILEIVEWAGTEEARNIMSDISEKLETGADLTHWTTAIQLARDLGAIKPDQAYALLDVITEAAFQPLTETDTTLVDLSAQIDAIKRADGLSEDEDYYIWEGPSEWQRVNRLWDNRADQIRAEMFRAIGEPGMATSMMLDPQSFNERIAAGRRDIFEVRENARSDNDDYDVDDNVSLN